MPSSSDILGFIESITPQAIVGWAMSPDDPEPIRLTLRIDGEDGPSFECNLARNDVWEEREDVRLFTDPEARLGFAIHLTGVICDDRRHVFELVAEDGQPVALNTPWGARQSSWDFAFPSIAVQGMVEPGGPGDPIHGWVVVREGDSETVRKDVEVLVSTPTRVLATLQASGHREDVARVLDCGPDCGFIYWPADDVRDGPVQNVHFTVLPEGIELPNSPVAIGASAVAAVPEQVLPEPVTVPEAVAPEPVTPEPVTTLDVGDAWPTLVALFFEPHYMRVAALKPSSLVEKLRHFATEGLRAGLSPSPLFDPAVYLAKAEEAGLPTPLRDEPALLHWLRHGMPARVVPNRVFDEDYYLARNPRVAAVGRFGFDQYLSEGLHAGLRPNAWFDPVWYRASIADLPAGMPAFFHFLDTGRASGLSPNSALLPAFLPAAPLDAWTGVGTSLMAAVDELTATIGPAGTSFLLGLYQDSYYRLVAGLGANVSVMEGLHHFLSQGLALGLSPSPLFEPAFYAQAWQDTTGAPAPDDQPLILHWLQHGRARVSVPTRLFLEVHYRQQWSDMVDPAIDVFAHFVQAGINEGRQANPWFEPTWFKRQAGDRLTAAAPAYAAFLTSGDVSLACRILWLLSGGTHATPADITASTLADFIDAFARLVSVTGPWLKVLSAEQLQLAALLFSPETYRGGGAIGAEHSVIEKLAHFIQHELANGVEVGPLFDAEFYRQQAASQGLPLDPATPPLLHFLEHGRAKRIVPTRLFDEHAYLQANPDLKAYPGWLFLHFIKDGLYEGRTYTTKPMIVLAPDFTTTPVEGARRKLLTRVSEAIGVGDALSPGLQKMVRAQTGAAALLASQEFDEIMRRAQAIEPGVGERLEARDLLIPPLHDAIASKFTSLRARLRRQSYDQVVCIPWMRSGGADLVAGFLLRALGELFPGQSILLLRTDQPHFEREDWIPDGIDVVDMSDVTRSVPALEAERLLFALLRGLRPRAIYNVNSRLCWLFLRRFGQRMPSETKLFSYLFCWDQTATGVRVGYPTEFFPDAQSCLAALFTDTRYLKNELIRTYALPAEVSRRIVPLASPSDSLATSPTMAEFGVETAQTREAPLFLWGGRLDLQKRFDLLVAIARRMPECRFLCWGTAMLDAPPDLSTLPPNVTMMGAFKHLTDLPLGASDGWIFTSAWEGLPTTIIELGKVGMPIVASAVGGVPELIDGSTGWLVEPFDSVDGFVAALREMIDAPRERVGRAKRLQDRICSRHTMQSYKAALAKAIALEQS